MQKKFFLISQVFYPDEVSTAGLFTNLCEEIAGNNIAVQVWCAQPSYNTQVRQPKKLNYKGITIHYLSSTNFNKSSLVGRLLNYLTFSVSLSFKLLFSTSKTPVFTSTNPPFLGFFVAFFCYLKKRKVNYIIQDIFPEGLVRLGKLSEKSLIVKFWNQLNRFTLKHSNKIIIIGRDMQLLVSKVYKPALEKTLYIPIWQDGNRIKPMEFEQNEMVIKNNWQTKFVVQYSGNMGLWNDMKSFGNAINEINEPDILFTFYGDGIRKKELIDSLGVEKTNVLYFPFQPKEKLNQLLTACHVALVSLAEGLEGIAVPSKIIGIMAAGIPVIAMVPEESEIAYIVRENKCGIVLNPGDSNGLKEAILELKNNKELRKQLSENARYAFDKNFNTSLIAEQYIQLI